MNVQAAVAPSESTRCLLPDKHAIRNSQHRPRIYLGPKPQCVATHFVPPDEAPSAMASTDRDALMAIYSSAGGYRWILPGWTHEDRWGTGAELSEWFAVDVNAEGRVVKLDLSNNNNLQGHSSLEGFLPTLAHHLPDHELPFVCKSVLHRPKDLVVDLIERYCMAFMCPVLSLLGKAGAPLR
ncbi:unnamed protein product [Ectocarpus sp. 8 AP-2014]